MAPSRLISSHQQRRCANLTGVCPVRTGLSHVCSRGVGGSGGPDAMNPDTLPQCERAYLGLEMPWPRLPAGNAHPSSVCVAVSIMRVHRGPRDLGDRAGRLLHAATPRLLSRYSRQQRPVSLDSCRCGLVPVVRDFQGPFWTALAPTQMSRNMPTWKHACLRSAVQQATWPDPATLA